MSGEKVDTEVGMSLGELAEMFLLFFRPSEPQEDEE